MDEDRTCGERVALGPPGAFRRCGNPLPAANTTGRCQSCASSQGAQRRRVKARSICIPPAANPHGYYRFTNRCEDGS